MLIQTIYGANLFNKDFNISDKNLQKTIFINKEINSNQIILEKIFVKVLQIKKKSYIIKLIILVIIFMLDNRDSYYDNNLYSYYLFLIK